MTLLDGDLARVFGAALGAVYGDGTLGKAVTTDDGQGGFSVAFTTLPVKAMVERVTEKARAASGLPERTVSIGVLRAGLAATVDLDDHVTVSGQVYRAIGVETDPAGAAWVVSAVPL